MKKKLIAALLVATMVLSITACGDSTSSEETPLESSEVAEEESEEEVEEEIEKKISHEFNTETNIKEQYYGIAYEVPSSWKKDTNIDSHTVTYDIGQGDKLILTYANTNNYGDSAKPYESDVIKSFSSNFENYSLIDKYETKIGSDEIPTINVLFSWGVESNNYTNHLLFFKCYTNLISFLFQSDDASEYDRSSDYNDIINSIHKWNAETDSSYTPTEITTGQANALSTARDYLNSMAFSYTGLIEQLEYEGYTTEEATYAADNCNADWNEQAAKCAQQYLDTMSFSRSGLIEQLEYEGFTAEQAEYGVSAVGY